MATTKVIRTYGSKKTAQPRPTSSSPVSEAKESPPARKRTLHEHSSNLALEHSTPPLKRVKTSHKSKENVNFKSKQTSLTQLHFCIDQTIMKTCSKCSLTYTKGAPDDERLHRTQCARIQRGMEWGREEEKEGLKNGLSQMSTGVKLKDGSMGRIICFRADVGGKIGSKVCRSTRCQRQENAMLNKFQLTSLLETINLTLSSPPLSPPTLHASKAYLFLLPSSTSSSREKIAGCVIAQRISTAMEIASSADCETARGPTPDAPRTPPTAALVAVDTSTGLFCHPAPIPTPLGIPRLFVPLAHRRQGIASHLLSAAAKTLIHGCPLDPRKGQVAFTQPTGDGRAVMTRWGGGRVRIYEE